MKKNKKQEPGIPGVCCADLLIPILMTQNELKRRSG